MKVGESGGRNRSMVVMGSGAHSALL